MPSTYSPQDALNLVQQYGHGLPISAVQSNVCDIINSIIWCYYPWGWSIQSLTPTNLLANNSLLTLNTQDYPITGAWFTFPITLNAGGTVNNNYGGGWPIEITPNGLSESGSTVTITLQASYLHNLPTGATLAGQTGTIIGADNSSYNGTVTITNIPSTTQIVGTISNSGLSPSGAPATPGILRFLKPRIGRVDIVPNEWRELAMLANLAPELTRQGGIDTMRAVGWFPSQNFIRFDLSVYVGTGQILQLKAEYQQVPTKITDTNLTDPFLFPDQYFDVFVEGLKWKIYQLSDDPRAGTIQVTKNGGLLKQYTGQWGIFWQMLNEMARTEDLGTGDEFMYPEAPMGVGRSYWPGLFGM